MTDRPRRDENAPSQHIARAILSFALAYPLSGAICWLVSIVSHPLVLVKNPGVAIFMLFFWIVTVPGCGGFILAEEADAGPRHNMYPWIIPTGLALFSLLKRLGVVSSETIGLRIADSRSTPPHCAEFKAAGRER